MNKVILNMKELKHLLINIGCDTYEGDSAWLDTLEPVFKYLLENKNLRTLILFINNWKNIQEAGLLLIYYFIE
jgi:hypothetical protein